MRHAVMVLLCLVASFPFIAAAQPVLSARLSRQYTGSPGEKSRQISADIDKQTARYLSQLQKQESRIRQTGFCGGAKGKRMDDQHQRDGFSNE